MKGGGKYLLIYLSHFREKLVSQTILSLRGTMTQILFVYVLCFLGNLASILCLGVCTSMPHCASSHIWNGEATKDILCIWVNKQTFSVLFSGSLIFDSVYKNA